MQRHALHGAQGAVEVVSILIQPEGRMQQLVAEVAVVGGAVVSILIQPEGRMQQRLDQALVGELLQFQSSSSPRAGCNARR